MSATSDPRDIALGAAVTGVRVAIGTGRVALMPFRLAFRAPLVGAALRRRADDLAHEGGLARADAQSWIEEGAAAALTSPELERLVTRVLEATDWDRIVAAVLDHDRTEQLVGAALASHGLERMTVRIVESRLVDELTERVLNGPELDRVIEHVARSPAVLDVVGRQSRTLAEEMASTVRRRAERVDDAAERTARGWLRRPRPQTT